MRVIVPALDPECPAVLALCGEGLTPDVRLLADDRGYGRLFTDLWSKGETFAIVEHDVVPWPGAVAGLFACAEPYCGHYYPISRKLGGTMGCVKFGAELIERVGPLDARDVPWDRLDGVVAAKIEEHAGMDDFHIHTPPVAHLHRYR